jgi:hypothetical protein
VVSKCDNAKILERRLELIKYTAGCCNKRIFKPLKVSHLVMDYNVRALLLLSFNFFNFLLKYGSELLQICLLEVCEKDRLEAPITITNDLALVVKDES